MVSISSRQVSPFQALINMIKINYLGKTEVFKALIAVLCDYDKTNPRSISKTWRYIRILLTGNPDLAECLISFLPQSTSQDKGGKNNPVYQPGHDPLSTKSNSISRQPECLTHHHSRPSQQDTKSIPTRKDCHGSLCDQITGFTNNIQDVKTVTESEVSHDETSPHPRPLMVPHPGSAANHFHVIRESGNKAFPIRPELMGINPPPFQVSLSLSSFPVHHHGLSAANAAEEKKALDLSVKEPKGARTPWMKSGDFGVQIHPLLQSVNTKTNNSVPQTLVCSIKQEVNSASQIVNRAFLPYITDPPKEHRVSTTGISPPPLTIGAYGRTDQANRLNQANASLHISPESVSQHPDVNSSSMQRLLNEGLRPLATANPALSHLLGMTRVSPTSDEDKRKTCRSSLSDDHIPEPLRKVPRLKSQRVDLESLKEITSKLKVAESKKAMKQSLQYANMINPVLKNQSPVRFRVAGIPFQIVGPKQQCLDQGHTRNLTSFPYMQQIILPDGDVRTLNIDNSTNKTELSEYEHENESLGHTGTDNYDESDQQRKRKHKSKKGKRKGKSENESVLNGDGTK